MNNAFSKKKGSASLTQQIHKLGVSKLVQRYEKCRNLFGNYVDKKVIMCTF